MTGLIQNAQVAVALDVVDAVRQYGVDAVSRNLAHRPAEHVVRVAATLAALVPDDRPVSELLAWANGPESLSFRRVPLYGRDQRMLKPCGTRAAFIRHKSHGEQPCQPCLDAERAYQRARKRQGRAA